MLNDDNLRASVKDGRHPDAPVDEDIELLQGKTEGWWSDAGEWQIIRKVIVHGDTAWGWLRVRCMYHLILISLHTAHLQFVSYVFVDGVASCKDVSGHGKRKLAL
jgi:hypothetical protein